MANAGEEGGSAGLGRGEELGCWRLGGWDGGDEVGEGFEEGIEGHWRFLYEGDWHGGERGARRVIPSSGSASVVASRRCHRCGARQYAISNGNSYKLMADAACNTLCFGGFLAWSRAGVVATSSAFSKSAVQVIEGVSGSRRIVSCTYNFPSAPRQLLPLKRPSHTSFLSPRYLLSRGWIADAEFAAFGQS